MRLRFTRSRSSSASASSCCAASGPSWPTRSTRSARTETRARTTWRRTPPKKCSKCNKYNNCSQNRSRSNQERLSLGRPKDKLKRIIFFELATIFYLFSNFGKSFKIRENGEIDAQLFFLLKISVVTVQNLFPCRSKEFKTLFQMMTHGIIKAKGSFPNVSPFHFLYFT